MLTLRKWVTPLTIGSFVLMFYHLDSGVNKLAHQWFSWLFLAGVVLHIATNWVSFQRYFSSAKGLAVIAVMLAILGASFYPWQGLKPEPPARSVMKVLGKTPLAELAPIAHATPDEVVAKVRAKGFNVASADQTPADIAGDPKKSDMVLGTVFAEKKDK